MVVAEALVTAGVALSDFQRQQKKSVSVWFDETAVYPGFILLPELLPLPLETDKWKLEGR
jgi:hypothetical protein